MTYNVVALTEELPHARSVIRGLKNAHPDFTIRGASKASVIRLRDEEGRPFVSVEMPQAVEATTDVRRLLGDEAADHLTHNAWWVEVRAPANNPRAAEAAHRFAATLVEHHGGQVWPTEPRWNWAMDLPTGEADHPSALVETEKSRVVAVDSPVVGLSAAIADALAAGARDSRGLQVLTPASAHITHSLRKVLAASGCRWVVEGPGNGHYDGLTGMPLTWEDDLGFQARRDGAPPALAEQRGDPGLALDLHFIHPAEADLRLGEMVEHTTKLMCGEPPTAWGTNEPALMAWDPGRLTDLCRGRAPNPTRVVFSGPGFAGTLNVSRVVEGVKESLSLVAGNADHTALPELLAELPDSFQSLTTHRVPGAADTHYRPVLGGASAPLGLALGPEVVAQVGRAKAMAAPVAAETIGPLWSSVLWYPLGEREPRELWRRFQGLMDHLGQGPT
ncbi:DUF6177 family protein [Nocardiopsis sp. JB363]|uniref:DUF6177 family protein n=1 Tax=Nocardiopsis sp. JB363 TaxID=1434837 RepID=UPI00097A07A9|nr:DUF6177 family protein [Nocardiopsis sp. JB363]SIO86105.1 hypothetical protein BQ8420_10310 [Nocardiopsis sp. JB363]